MIKTNCTKVYIQHPKSTRFKEAENILIKNACEKIGLSFSSFIRMAALKESIKVIRELKQGDSKQ